MVLSCANKQYTFQEFLLECPYNNAQIETYNGDHLDEVFDHESEYNLIDYYNGFVRRRITLSKLDRIIDTDDDFQHFVNDNLWINELIIVDDRPRFDNPILSNYNNNTIKAYLYRLNHAGLPSLIARIDDM